MIKPSDDIRIRIAEAIYEVSNEWVRGNFPADWTPERLEDRPRELRLHLDYADRVLQVLGSARPEPWRDPTTAPRDGSHFIGLMFELGDDDWGTPDVTQAEEVWFAPTEGFFGDGLPWRSGGIGHDGQRGDKSSGVDCLKGWIPLPPALAR